MLFNIDKTIGSYVKIGSKFYKITAKDFLYIKKTYSSVAGNSSSSDTILTDVKPKEGQLYCFKILPLTSDLKVELKQPAAVSRGGTEAQPLGYIDNNMLTYEWHKNIEMPVFATTESRQLIAVFVNTSGSAITPELIFSGYKYAIEEVSETPSSYEEIIVEGLK